ncbi:LysM domain protein [Caballeronia pedi]|uniref:LysM domain protein n=1 Tax=Caballeronia pedi TaxID=1777141 RepID=A0A158BK83_9BURK|nr:LysM domain-containing protein [Caballeronia pedi]SAK70443.1 LysM domain protein [Caballeronia pedi]
MAVEEQIKNKLEIWKEERRVATRDKNWNSWDSEIQTAVSEYNHHLFGESGYFFLDWRIIKAMVWVESNANNPSWQTKPMQIGVGNDPGLTSFLSGKEGGDLIVPPMWRGRLTIASVRSTPAHNIRAGIGYLLMRMANFKHQSVLNTDSAVYDVTVKVGDSLEKIAKTQGSTVEVMKRLNPTVSVLRPGQVLKYQKASIQRVITGWQHISPTSIANFYNGGGDPNYANKLQFVLDLIYSPMEGQ